MRPARRRVRGAAALLCVAVGLLLAGCAPEQPTPSPSPSRTAGAAVFHVDCGAPAGGDGSAGRPWNALATVNEHGAFLPGERILLARGTVCSGRLTPQGSGTNGDPIVLGAYGTGAQPVVHGGGTPDQTGAVQLTDQHDWIVQDLQVTNLDAGGPSDALRAGILVLDDGSGALGRVVVRRTTVRQVTSSPAGATADPHEFGGISVLVRGTATRAGALTDIRLEDNLVDHVGRTGIVAWSDAWPASPLRGVSITGNRVVEAEGDGVVVWGVDGGVLEHDVVEGFGHLPACPRCANPTANTASAGIWPVMSTRILMRYDEASGGGAGGGDGQGFDLDDGTSDVVLEGSWSHDNDGGGVLICGTRGSEIRSNVFADDGGGEITFSCPTQRDGVRIVDNTVLLAAGSTAQVVRHNRTSGTDPVVFANNLVIDLNGGGYAWPVPVTAQGNVYAGTLPATKPADATAAVDPGLLAPGTAGTGLDSVRGFTPLPGTAAASGGVQLPDAGTLDYFGRTRTGEAGRGAIAATSSPAALAPVVPTAARADGDVTLTWSADRGTGWLLQRSEGGGAFRAISGVLRAGAFVDADPPAGAVRYRLVQAGRDRSGDPSAPVGVPAG
ncbi:hypothetical protein [uncultured Amnibacterium sp.]|uniref:hypothetical protein n=1 Tax=uncultured Amnibacterium sp. TaxID=1631851 RepID=UPI0035CB22F7